MIHGGVNGWLLEGPSSTGDREHTERRWDVQRLAIVVVLIVIVALLVILGLSSALLVDWVWFAPIGYGQVFWTVLGAKALLFCTVLVASTILLWVNAAVAYRFARPRGLVRRMDFERESLGLETFPELLERTRQRLPWRRLLVWAAGILGLLVAVGDGTGGR
jgi:uncharacterized membrane protein (UPF0182 family)